MGDRKRAIEYSDTRMRFTWNVGYQYPLGIGGTAGLEVYSPGSGSSFTTSLYATVNPTDGKFTVGPIFRLGQGLELGVMLSGKQLGPYARIGGLQYIHGAGVCAGLVCVNRGGLGVMDPKALILAVAVRAFASILKMEREDSPMSVLASVISDLNPVARLIDTLSVFRIPLGRGPKARTISTRSGMSRYLLAIKKLIEGNGQTDAIKRLRGALKKYQEPFIEAELRRLLDKAYHKRNAGGMPLDSGAIEKSIRGSVDAVEKFTRTYAKWLKEGKGCKPSESAIKHFMARSLHLARKVQFTFKQTKTKTKIVRKITTSEPFRISDPKLAVRYAEVVAAVFRALSDTKSGLAKHIKAETQWRYGAFLQAVGAPRKNPVMYMGSLGYVHLPGPVGKPAERMLEAEARYLWHVGWIQSMQPLFDIKGGMYHRRLEHVRYIVRKKAKGQKKKALLKRLDDISLVDATTYRAGMKDLLTTKIPAKRYTELRPAIEALRVAEDIAKIQFPGTLGDGTLLLDAQRARTYDRRPQIVDALYHHARLKKVIAAAKARKSTQVKTLERIARIVRKRIITTMLRYKVEVRREYADYGYAAGGHWKTALTGRVRDIAGVLKGLPFKDMRALRKSIRGDSKLSKLQKTILESQFAEFEKAAKAEMKYVKSLALASTKFKRGVAPSETTLHTVERAESKRIRDLYQKRRAKIIRAYLRLKIALTAANLHKKKDVKKFIKDAEGKLRSMLQYMSKAVVNYNRFNTRRVGVYYLDTFRKALGISRLTPRSEDECVVCP